ncbi:8977_t:CDS:10 [Cetraspora pellucida]|uniref:8977_t:CDS:1 n=1 Tax=Cetraspora pellucida TaxID=1433469 RepID=A0A9N9IL47_9GLOM|nr:8977_t:CDS:10 [Cetraspora pellucida]
MGTPQKNITEITTKISAIKEIYKNIQYNKRICISLMERIEFVDFAIAGNLQKNMINNFTSLVQVLDRTEIFMKNISQLYSYMKYMDLDHNLIEREFDALINEFSAVFQEIPQVHIRNDNDKENFKQDSDQMREFVTKIRDKIIDIGSIIKTVETLKMSKNQPPGFEFFEITYDKLIDPFIEMSSNLRGNRPYVKKRFYNSIEVACKPLTRKIDEKGLQIQLSILEKLRKSSNILRFYGVSNFENTRMLVNEWAELGTLKNVYENYKIDFYAKIFIAAGICNGLMYLHSYLVLHREIRCVNILMTKDLAPKISNFEQSHLSGTSLNDINLENVANKLFKDYQDIIRGAWEQEPSSRSSWAHIYPRMVDLKSNVPKEHFIKHNPLTTKANKRERRPSVSEEQNIVSIPFEKLTNMERIDEKSYIAKKALNEATGALVVCKEFDNNDGEFIRELNIMKGLKNQYIIEFIGISEDKENHIYYIITEYAEEGDLRFYLEKNFKELDFKKQLQFALNIARGLEYLHSKKILHRDLHDKNIVISRGNAKIIDFGNSVHANNQENITLFGFFPFVAPELIRNRNNIEYTYKSDIYSLGVILWELTSGHEPFKHSKLNPQDLISKIVSDKFREKDVRGTHRDYHSLYKNCWEDAPNKRPNIEDVLKNLVKISNEMNGNPPGEKDPKIDLLQFEFGQGYCNSETICNTLKPIRGESGEEKMDDIEEKVTEKK